MTAVDRPDNGHDDLPWLEPFYRWAEQDKSPGSYSAAFAAGWRAAFASGRAGAGEQQREQNIETLRPALLAHHPIMRSETGPLSGCRCGHVGIGQDVIAHVADELLALLGGPQPDGDPAPQCPSTSHGTDGGWRCAVDGPHEQHANAAGDARW